MTDVAENSGLAMYVCLFVCLRQVQIIIGAAPNGNSKVKNHNHLLKLLSLGSTI
jgi:hypothetical protein